MINQDEVGHIAHLAKIGLKKEELKKYQKELDSILNFFGELKKVDTEKIDPIGHISGVFNVMRSDKAIKDNQLERGDILKNVPDKKDDYVKVRAVL